MGGVCTTQGVWWSYAWNAVMVSALTQALGREFHSGTVLTKNECLYWAVCDRICLNLKLWWWLVLRSAGSKIASACTGILHLTILKSTASRISHLRSLRGAQFRSFSNEDTLAYKSTPDFEGKNCPKFFDLYASTHGKPNPNTNSNPNITYPTKPYYLTVLFKVYKNTPDDCLQCIPMVLPKAPFTWYNQLSDQLSIRFDNRLYRVYKHSFVYTAGCQTGCTTQFDNRLNEQWLFVPVERTVAVRSTWLSTRLSNWFDNRLDVCLHDTADRETGCTTGCIV